MYDVYRCGMDQELRFVKNHTRDQHTNTQNCWYITSALIFSSKSFNDILVESFN